MKIVVLDQKKSHIAISGKTLAAGEQKIPLRLIDTLIVAQESSLSTKTLIALGESGIVLLCVDSRNRVTITHSAKAYNAELKLAQYRAAMTPIEIAKYILKCKVESHGSMMEEHSVVMDHGAVLDQIADADTIEQLLGIEGAFARSYFGYFFSLLPKALHKGKRSKQPPADPVNAMLSYYYTLFYHLIAIRLMAFGFEPSIGYLHRPFRSHYALASDLLECFRAEINAEILRLFGDGILMQEDFSKKGEGVYLRYESRRALWREFKHFYDEKQPRIDAYISRLRGML